jgi:hypothetical protein
VSDAAGSEQDRQVSLNDGPTSWGFAAKRRITMTRTMSRHPVGQCLEETFKTGKREWPSWNGWLLQSSDGLPMSDM